MKNCTETKLSMVLDIYSVQQTDQVGLFRVILTNSYILYLNVVVGSYAHGCHIFSTVTDQAQAVKDFFVLTST